MEPTSGNNDSSNGKSKRQTTAGRSRTFNRLTGARWKALGSSLLVHAALFALLALLTFPMIDKKLIPILMPESEPLEELEELEDLPEQEFTDVSLQSSTSMSNLAQNANQTSTSTLSVAPPSIDELMAVETLPMEAARLTPDLTAENALTKGEEVTRTGKGRVVVDSYDQAFDKLTQEILDMLYEGKVLVVWLFDQSGSMKDDQKVIRDRLEKIYVELGITKEAGGGNMMTSVASFGSNYQVHVEEPTDRLELIQKAIDSIPVDLTGEERMCPAIAQTIELHRDYAKRQRRQFALILVSDESGNMVDNQQILEQTIELAKNAKCRIYTLGREAVFGYPYAHFVWEHPQTYVVHHIPVDRGPESGMLEQLQTEGFAKRQDSHPSGFGPYEQSRMAWETGGMFFMLPSVELDVVDQDKRRYRLDAMNEYVPDLRTRYELLQEIAESPLRTGLTQIIYDMNPYNEHAAKIIVMRTKFSKDIREFVSQVQTEQAKIAIYSQYLDRMRAALDDIWELREDEQTPRWQANADLLRAQLLVYRIRLFEYAAYLQYFMSEPKVVAPTKPPDEHFLHWSLGRRQEMISEEVTGAAVEEAKQMLQVVIDNHPGTPWAARAEKELESGLGVELVPYYHRVPESSGGSEPLIPVPKL